MRAQLSITMAALITAAAATYRGAPVPVAQGAPRAIESMRAGKFPSDWFLRQRAWPQDDIDQAARLEAHAQARALHSIARGGAGGSWQPVGPTNVGGRIADVVCHPTDANIVYAGTASGGVYKSTDAGTSWIPTFDDESALSIGSVAIDPTSPDVVWVGTGEPNGGGGSVTYGGTGVFRSTNAGVAWESMGLAETRYIGRVLVDPADGNRVFVAALGSQWSPSPDRGVYRTTDAGASWQLVLASTESTGAVDLAIHPTNTQIVYAAMWERSRGPDFIDYGGTTSGIFRSTDGGDTWAELTAGLPSGDRGRIGITLCESQPQVLYAIYAESNPGAFAGVFKTTNGGNSWTQTNDGALSDVYASYGWWFGNIRVAPNDPNRVYAIGFDFYRTTNGGSSWSFAGGSMHVDHHGLDFASNGRLFEGNDGGMYTSLNGTTWTKLNGLAVSQFYAIAVNEQNPLQRYGGLQDNGTNRTLTGAPDDWVNILGGDGFRPLVDPVSPQWVYAEYQYGELHRSSNGGSTFTYIAGSLAGRKNWSMPVELNPSNPATLVAGTDRVYRTTNRGTTWTAISPDLTDGDGGINVVFGTITALAIAPTSPGTILAGTDDANVWITTNSGLGWSRVDATLPERWITRVAFDPDDAAIGYVTISGFKWDESQPHVFRTTNHGADWADISSNLPEAPVNDVIVDPSSSGTLYVGTDFGVFTTTDTGGSWQSLGTGLPNVVVADLTLHDPTRTLVAGTYGRSMWTFDLAGAVDASDLAIAPESVEAPMLRPIRPNPARDSFEVRWVQPRPARVALEVFDVAGRRIATLAEGDLPAGSHARSWDRRGANGARIAAGVVFVRLSGDGVATARKVVLVD